MDTNVNGFEISKTSVINEDDIFLIFIFLKLYFHLVSVLKPLFLWLKIIYYEIFIL